MTTDNGHECPRDGCERRVPADMLACKQHWFSVPSPLRRALWQAWDGGRGALSDAHIEAMAACVRAMNGH